MKYAVDETVTYSFWNNVYTGKIIRLNPRENTYYVECVEYINEEGVWIRTIDVLDDVIADVAELVGL